MELMQFLFSRRQKLLFADKMMDLGNLAVAGLIFTQLFSNSRMNLIPTGIGVTLSVFTYLIAYRISV